MLTLDQIRARKASLGASDCPPIVLGKDGYGRTASDVYLDKITPVPEVLPEPSYAMRVGNTLEPLMLAEVGRQKKIVVAPASSLKSDTYDWLSATPDGLSDDYVIECKAHGFHRRFEYGSEGDQVPADVLVQTHVQMLVSGKRKAIVAATLGTEFRMFDVDFDANLAGMILKKTERFWKENVLAKSPPPFDGTESATAVLRAIYPSGRQESVLPSTEALTALVAEYTSAKGAFTEAEKELELRKQRLMAAMGDFEKLATPAGTVSWKMRAGYERPASMVSASRVFMVRAGK